MLKLILIVEIKIKYSSVFLKPWYKIIILKLIVSSYVINNTIFLSISGKLQHDNTI